MSALTAHLLKKVDHIEQLKTTKLNAAASLLWALAATTEYESGGGDGGTRPPSIETLLHKYFLDECDLEKAGWAAPFRTKPLPPTLRGDVLDFVSTHFAESNTAAKQGQAQAPLTGRAIARILHKIHSPAFPKKSWENTRFWGLHREVDFDVLKRVGDEQLETARRRAMKVQMQQPRKRQR